MKRRLALLAAVFATAIAGTTAAAPAAPVAPAVAAKSCNSGWTHAVIGGEHKCLRAGQFCAHARDREYHRYGYHCHRYDSSVERYRLTG